MRYAILGRGRRYCRSCRRMVIVKPSKLVDKLWCGECNELIEGDAKR